ncbi:MAG: substrate-binding domain-containing protein [Nitrososphaerota archaeon]|jgi:molybdenum ABC transporter molybdate-binding protein|nr:substrate-binding domain-containing protein [Nitrososphaerota archaeon]
MPTIKVAAAASLKNGLDDIIADFEGSTGNTVSVDYAGFYALADIITTIGNTTYDIYLAASDENDLKGMKKVSNAGKILPYGSSTIPTNYPFLFIANDLVLIRNSKGTFLGVNSFGTVNSTTVGIGQHIWIANIEKAPAGEYAKAAFNLTNPSSWNYLYGKAGNDVTIGDDVQKTLEGVVVDNDIKNKQALGVVYNSDYLNLPSVPGTKTFLINYAPASVNTTVKYSVAVLINADTPHGVKAEAEAFVSLLRDVQNQNFLQTKGFRLLDNPPKDEN